jgi:hypothetical protein
MKIQQHAVIFWGLFHLSLSLSSLTFPTVYFILANGPFVSSSSSPSVRAYVAWYWSGWREGGREGEGKAGGRAAKRAGYRDLSVCVCVWLPSLFSFCPNNSSKCNNTRYLNTHIFVCWICPDDAHASCCWHNTHIRAHAEGKLIESCKSQRRRGKIGVTYIPSFSRRHCCCRWSRAKKVTNENSVMSCSLSLFWHWQDGVAVQCCARMHLDLGMFSRCLAESSAMMDQDLTHLIGLFFLLLKKSFV